MKRVASLKTTSSVIPVRRATDAAADASVLPCSSSPKMAAPDTLIAWYSPVS